MEACAWSYTPKVVVIAHDVAHDGQKKKQGTLEKIAKQ